MLNLVDGIGDPKASSRIWHIAESDCLLLSHATRATTIDKFGSGDKREKLTIKGERLQSQSRIERRMRVWSNQEMALRVSTRTISVLFGDEDIYPQTNNAATGSTQPWAKSLSKDRLLQNTPAVKNDAKSTDIHSLYGESGEATRSPTVHCDSRTIVPSSRCSRREMLANALG